MNKTIITAARAPLYAQPDPASERLDEALFGMAVSFAGNAPAGWVRAAFAGREGYMAADGLLPQTEPAAKAAAGWLQAGKLAVRAPFLDVLALPDYRGPLLATLPRGGLLRPAQVSAPEGWLAVSLPGGETGFARQTLVMAHLQDVKDRSAALRDAIATTALSYLGVQYRWAGRSPAGVDATGLVAMAYLLNGIDIGRPNAPDGLLAPLAENRPQTGDVIFFREHAGIYLGDDRFVHASSLWGDDAVVINSLHPASPFYSAALVEQLTSVGSVF